MTLAAQPFQAPRRRRPVLALLTASSISYVGTGLTSVALPWFVLQTTGSAARTGLTAFAFSVPMAAAGVFGGPLIDRLGAKRVAVVADIVSAIGIGLVPLLYTTVGLPFWALLTFVFIGAVLELPGLTARRSMLPDLAALGGVRLERVNAASEATQYLSLLLGPPLAGLLIAWFGPSRVLWLDAGSFLVSASIVAALVPSVQGVVSKADRYLTDLADGFRFLRQDRLLIDLAITLTLGNLLTGPLFAVLLPVYVEETVGRATALGAVAGAFGVGALLGALIFGAVGHRLPRRFVWLLGFLAMPIELWVLAISPSIPVLAGTLALVGILSGGINPLLVTIRHERIPADLRGRVFGTFSAIAMAAQPVGMLIAGALVSGIGLSSTTLLLASLAQMMSLAPFFIPTLHQMNSTRTASHTAAPATP